MPLTNDGAEVIADRLVGTGSAAFDNANAYIGVGDSTTAFTQTQSDLLGTNTHREEMDGGYPTHTTGTNQITFRATFESADANFTWQEWGIFNASSGGTMLNRVVEDNGEKVSGHTWEFSVTITIQA